MWLKSSNVLGFFTEFRLSEVSLAESVQNWFGFSSFKNVVCTMVDLKQDKWTRWYALKKFPPILKESVLGMQCSETKEEFYAILEVLQILIGKFNFWIDRVIPWMTISSVFDWTLQGK